ncbi:MAG: DctP family TRAP transporter solute-binding subunit [Planctomycetota bacterium]|nr:DctP family TRAP transporter solute-binding subunit [Planctomycetota bacterium]
MRRVLCILALVSVFSFCARAGEIVKLRMGLDPGNASIEYEASMEFINGVAKRIGGRVDIQMFAGGQLGDDRALLEQISAGVLDLGQGDIGRWQLWIPYADIFGLPYIFDSYQHIFRTLDGEEGRNYKKQMLDQGWRVLSVAYNGTRQTSSNRAITSLDDMKGLKLRVPNATANMNFAKFTGASPTPMAFNEVYMALKTGAVDAQENPLPAVLAMKFYEVQKYISMTSHIINCKFFVASEETWRKLPGDIRKAMEESAAEAARFQTERFVRQEKELTSFFREKGLVINEPDLEPFRAACKPIADEYVAKFGDKLYAAAMAAR